MISCLFLGSSPIISNILEPTVLESELSQLYSEESAPNGNSSSYIPPSLESLTQKHNLLCEKFDIYREQIRIATKLYTESITNILLE